MLAFAGSPLFASRPPSLIASAPSIASPGSTASVGSPSVGRTLCLSYYGSSASAVEAAAAALGSAEEKREAISSTVALKRRQCDTAAQLSLTPIAVSPPPSTGQAKIRTRPELSSTSAGGSSASDDDSLDDVDAQLQAFGALFSSEPADAMEALPPVTHVVFKENKLDVR